MIEQKPLSSVLPASKEAQAIFPTTTPKNQKEEATPTQGTILVVDDEADIRRLMAVTLKRAQYEVTLATNGQEALDTLRTTAADALPDVIISDIMMPEMDGLTMLKHLRSEALWRSIPVIMLTGKGTTDDVVAGLGLGADDYVAKPFVMPELLARIKVKMERRPVPADEIQREEKASILSERRFMQEVQKELLRVRFSRSTSCVAYLAFPELATIQDTKGAATTRKLAKQIADFLLTGVRAIDEVGKDAAGQFLLLFPEIHADEVEKRLTALAQAIMTQRFEVGGEHFRLTPAIGFMPFSSTQETHTTLKDHAMAALYHATTHMDLLPVRYTEAMEEAWQKFFAEKQLQKHWLLRQWECVWNKLRLPAQLTLVQMIALGLPFLFYVAMASVGMDITGYMYIATVIALLLTALFIWVENLLALKRKDPPEEPATPYPPASAIIAAYLPNEAATIVETVEAFLRVEYPAPLQIILAYNTPEEMPVEERLREIARRDARFLPVRIKDSTSKAQNVNKALQLVTGEFVGIFDADHHPEPGNFTRAWRWLSHGHDVVQGRCVIRNGEQSWMARLIAVEFEIIYGLSHPGRERLHQFGIFGGSNGYWKTELLVGTRMHGSMLTEDIDSSIRALATGHKVISDPNLISRELAPVTFKAMWNQRTRWAQGWFQVTLKHVIEGIRSENLSLHQKLGLIHLLVWREIYPWLTMQVLPIIAFAAWRMGGLQKLAWFLPFYVFTTLFTSSTGPGQTIVAYLKATPDLRKHKGWFLFYIVVSFFFYSHVKNLIAALAQVKELMHEHRWTVTPRAK